MMFLNRFRLLLEAIVLVFVELCQLVLGIIKLRLVKDKIICSMMMTMMIIAVSNRRYFYAIRGCIGIVNIRRPAQDIVFFIGDIGLLETCNQIAWLLLILCLSGVIHRVEKLIIYGRLMIANDLAWTRVCLIFDSKRVHLTLILLLLKLS